MDILFCHNVFNNTVINLKWYSILDNFLENAFMFLDKKERLLYFIIILLVTMFGAPIICGIIIQKLGGYYSYNVFFNLFIIVLFL